MNKEQQIAEIAKFVCNACEMGCGFEGECATDNDYKTCGISVETSKALYTAGYRKASEVAREIFEEIDRMCIDTFGNFNHRVFAELKKKYTEACDENNE